MKSSTDAVELGSVIFSDFTQANTLTLANHLFHEGDLAEARRLFKEVMFASAGDERLLSALCLAKVEASAGNHCQALDILASHYTLADMSKNHAVVWRFHSVYGGTWQLIAEVEGRREHYNRALEEYAGAAYYMELAGDHKRAGITRNNIALILAQLDMLEEADEQIDAARELLQDCPVMLAEVDDTEAQLRLKQGRADEGLELLLKANLTFKQHGETRLLIASSRLLEKAIAEYRIEVSRET